MGMKSWKRNWLDLMFLSYLFFFQIWSSRKLPLESAARSRARFSTADLAAADFGDFWMPRWGCFLRGGVLFAFGVAGDHCTPAKLFALSEAIFASAFALATRFAWQSLAAVSFAVNVGVFSLLGLLSSPGLLRATSF
jgi:hypothetical protein